MSFDRGEWETRTTERNAMEWPEDKPPRAKVFTVGQEVFITPTMSYPPLTPPHPRMEDMNPIEWSAAGEPPPDAAEWTDRRVYKLAVISEPRRGGKSYWRQRAEDAEGRLIDAGYRQAEDRAEIEALRSMLAGRFEGWGRGRSTLRWLVAPTYLYPAMPYLLIRYAMTPSHSASGGHAPARMAPAFSARAA